MTMALIYTCRHCGNTVGQITEIDLRSDQLGFNLLTNEERDEMISYDSHGNILVKSICEDCHESFNKNPALHQNDYLIH